MLCICEWMGREELKMRHFEKQFFSLFFFLFSSVILLYFDRCCQNILHLLWAVFFLLNIIITSISWSGYESEEKQKVFNMNKRKCWKCWQKKDNNDGTTRREKKRITKFSLPVSIIILYNLGMKIIKIMR